MKRLPPWLVCAAFFATLVLVSPCDVSGADGPASFTGDKTAWHGFDRYDFLMDEGTLAIQPYNAPADEGDGIKGGAKGQVRCIVVVPKTAAAGNPWSWRGCYWDHQPQAEIGLLKQGFCIVFVDHPPGKQWDAFYDFLTTQHGLSKKAAFVGMSRGGEYSFTWATQHPDKVSCIYADNSGGNEEMMLHLGGLARADVPVLLVCGSIDPILGQFSLPIEEIYHGYGGRASVMIKEGAGHHPHSLHDPAPIVDFMVRSAQEKRDAPLPAFAGDRAAKSSYYNIADDYRAFPQEDAKYITCRGAWFSPCYNRYIFQIGGVEAPVTVIEPVKAAPGTPWVFRPDTVGRNQWVDLALLERGYHIVSGPSPYNDDGPRKQEWDKIYNYLTQHGFARKAVMEGEGSGAGEVCAWAIGNPDKVAFLYFRNPVLRNHIMLKAPLMENLGPLARAGVSLAVDCGSLDPELNSALAMVDRYQALGGPISMTTHEGEGHIPLSRKDAKLVADQITAQK